MARANTQYLRQVKCQPKTEERNRSESASQQPFGNSGAQTMQNLQDRRSDGQDFRAQIVNWQVKHQSPSVGACFGTPGARVAPMNAPKKRPRTGHNAVILGRLSWIADELIGIRTLEHRLSRRLKSRTPQDSHFLFSRIQDLNMRVDLLDRALEEYVSPGRRA